jgi:hypothetical protein
MLYIIYEHTTSSTIFNHTNGTNTFPCSQSCRLRVGYRTRRALNLATSEGYTPHSAERHDGFRGYSALLHWYRLVLCRLHGNKALLEWIVIAREERRFLPHSRIVRWVDCYDRSNAQRYAVPMSNALEMILIPATGVGSSFERLDIGQTACVFVITRGALMRRNKPPGFERQIRV